MWPPLQEGNLDFLTTWQLVSKRVKGKVVKLLKASAQNAYSSTSTVFLVKASRRVSSDSRRRKMNSLPPDERDSVRLLGRRNSWWLSLETTCLEGCKQGRSFSLTCSPGLTWLLQGDGHWASYLVALSSLWCFLIHLFQEGPSHNQISAKEKIEGVDVPFHKDYDLQIACSLPTLPISQNEVIRPL